MNPLKFIFIWIYYKIRYGITNDIHPTAKIGKGCVFRNWIHVGHGVVIGNRCRFGNYVSINAGSQVGDECNFQNYAHITMNSIVGKRCFFGAYVVFADEKYPATGKQVRRACRLGDNVIIGTHGVIAAIDMGDSSVLGASSVAYKDIPPYQVWAGTPARPILVDDEYALGMKREMVRADYDARKAGWEEMLQ